MRTLEDRLDEQLEQSWMRAGSDWRYPSGFARLLVDGRLLDATGILQK